MNLNLGELLVIKQTFEKRLDEELLKMDCFFQNYLWDGFSDEKDSKFITPDDFEAIQALTDKIKHMVLYIGCPNSVDPMIISICQRKIKHWQGETLFYGGMSDKGWVKGKQLRTKDCENIVRKSGRCEDMPRLIDSYIITGHFRWNNRGYILSRKATDLLKAYYSIGFSTCYFSD